MRPEAVPCSLVYLFTSYTPFFVMQLDVPPSIRSRSRSRSGTHVHPTAHVWKAKGGHRPVLGDNVGESSSDGQISLYLD